LIGDEHPASPPTAMAKDRCTSGSGPASPVTIMELLTAGQEHRHESDPTARLSRSNVTVDTGH